MPPPGAFPPKVGAWKFKKVCGCGKTVVGLGKGVALVAGMDGVVVSLLPGLGSAAAFMGCCTVTGGPIGSPLEDIM